MGDMAFFRTMYGLSMREISGVEFEKPFIPSKEYFSERGKHPESVDRGDVWRAIHRGSMPAMSANPEYDWDVYYSSYLRTYLERDVRSLYTGIADPPLYFCRDHDGVEIDLLVCDAGTLYPIEIKEHADPSGKDISSFSYIDRMPGVKRGPGGVVCLYDKIVPLGESDVTIPLGCI